MQAENIIRAGQLKAIRGDWGVAEAALAAAQAAAQAAE
jgi:hypothetical protein